MNDLARRMTKKKKSNNEGKHKLQSLRSINVALDGTTVRMAVNLGDGDLSLGLRRAVALAGLRL
jgi:hypothetical protein